MKAIIIFAALISVFCLLHATQAAPSDAAAMEPEANRLTVEEPDTELSRQKRATCDLLSGFGIQHSACAGHCLLRGNRGGYCNGRGVCVCRN